MVCVSSSQLPVAEQLWQLPSETVCGVELKSERAPLKWQPVT